MFAVSQVEYDAHGVWLWKEDIEQSVGR
jgi:hypothetical protein